MLSLSLPTHSEQRFNVRLFARQSVASNKIVLPQVRVASNKATSSRCLTSTTAASLLLYRLCRTRKRHVCFSFGSGVSFEEDSSILDVATRAARLAGKVIVSKLGADVLKTKAYASDLLTAVDSECEDVIRREIVQTFPGHAFLGEESVSSREDISALLASAGWLWIVDPIDGTTNFVSGQPMSAVSIGVAFAGMLRVGVIYDPFSLELYTAIVGHGSRLNGKPISVSQRAIKLADAVIASGAPPNPCSAAPCFRAMSLLAPPRCRTIRILGSAAINFAWTACGRLDAWFEPDLSPWDSAAGVLLVREAGGRVTDCEGKEWDLRTTRPVCASNGSLHTDLLEVLFMARATQLDPET